ncbi:phenylalanine--tRNA ligase subunit beta [Pantoea sp. Nvir]|uniref:phenylalanine--tRNA ligase subunit beta n=1 Tax=Pantoea sp. Nvir TaxID=2576760 RepID=UPI00135A7AA2|nr:phenylalanine--tRNA ligase subunit beta [Pantoea sp. Nvir]MXP66211.1 phenylalanine--tRNA ligase subunit beta [Pantoea sp. Nvir]CAJ0991685.1 Phenylalanine--tRNA ligase beta subunit [Pantoea sp. Nvir]
MKFSELWLREWVNPTLESAALYEQITMAGLEVNSVEPVAGKFYGVVVGEIVKCSKHPNAAKLYVTKVNIGSEHLLNIICSAPNCCQGLKVAVATIGSVLPGDVKVKELKLYGESSEGMLCSFSELGIPDDGYNGIIELPSDTPIGIDIRDYLNLNDNTIEISVTPNRADCLSIIGIARDIAVLNRLSLTVPFMEPVVATIRDTVSIIVDATDSCPRYLGRVVRGINVKAITPLWMREKLRRSGIRSIAPVVDITNYVLVELGQPMYVFDLDSIKGGIVVRMAKLGEQLMLFNGNNVILNNDVLVIADHQKALNIGGIFSNQQSSINEETQNILFECAYYDPLAITGRARRYGLNTDVAQRYERGVDPELQYKAIERATQLLLEICGGHAGPVIDQTHEASLPPRAVIMLRRRNLDRLIGHIIADDQVTNILTRLGCEVTLNQEGWKVVAPSWRFDMEIEEDLIEEVVRVYGYNNLPEVPVHVDLMMTQHRETDLSLKRVKNLLVDKGYQEAITYNFVDPKIQQLLHPGEKALILLRPISSDMSVMRLSLWPGLLSSVVYNQNRQQSHVRLFESGLRFVPDSKADLGVCQDLMLAGVLSGNRHKEHWDLVNQKVDFYDLKGDLESLLDLTGKLDAISFRAEANPALHPGQSAAVYLHEERIGFIGMVHPDLECKLNLHSRTLLFELVWNKIADCVLPNAREISRFPMNRRDIAVVVARNIPAASIITECKKAIFNQLVEVKLFDVYYGKGVEEGFKSLAISLMLQDTRRTLEEEEISATVGKCVAALKERFQATLRD